MKRWLLAVWIACMAASSAHSQRQAPEKAALTAIDSCIAQLDPALDVGYGRIAARCPRLAQSLERSGWAQWLPRGWKEPRNDLSAGSLAELRTVVERELQAPAVDTQAPSVQRLHEVLAGLGPTAQERSSLWSRFRAWLRTVVARNQRPDDGTWLDKLIERNGRSQTAIDLLTYASLALIIVLAVIIVVNEMRAAGWLRLRTSAAADNAALQPTRRSRLSWLDIERAPAKDKPRLLLELIIAKLTERRHLPPASALTVRELTRAVELADARDRERLSVIALAAERARYSAATLAPQAVNAAVESGRELLDRLDAASA